MRLNWEHLSLTKMSKFCLERASIHVHPSLYRELKLKFFLDVGGIAKTAGLPLSMALDVYD